MSAASSSDATPTSESFTNESVPDDAACPASINIVNFMDLVEASKHYPCIKRAWVEYLGEHPEPALDRVE